MYFVTKHIYKICVPIHIYVITGFPGGSVVKNLPAMQELQDTSVRSLGWQYSLEEGMGTHSSILAWEFHGQRRLVGYSPQDCRIDHDWSNLAHLHVLHNINKYILIGKLYNVKLVLYFVLEKEMATYSSILAWRITWMEEHGRLQSMGLQSGTRLSDFTFFLYFVLHALR